MDPSQLTDPTNASQQSAPENATAENTNNVASSSRTYRRQRPPSTTARPQQRRRRLTDAPVQLETPVQPDAPVQLETPVQPQPAAQIPTLPANNSANRADMGRRYIYQFHAKLIRKYFSEQDYQAVAGCLETIPVPEGLALLHAMESMAEKILAPNGVLVANRPVQTLNLFPTKPSFRRDEGTSSAAARAPDLRKFRDPTVE